MATAVKFTEGINTGPGITIQEDARGLRCPGPVLRLTVLLLKVQKGTIVELLADCHTFETDVRTWAERSHKTILSFRKESTHMVATVQF